MKKIIYRIIILLLIGVLLISSCYIFKNNKENKQQEEILVEIQKIVLENNINKQEDMVDIENLYKMNNDIIGWLRIENTNINYPVMQTKDRPNYYLRRDFYKNYSVWGTPFLSENCDILTSDNLIVYGHNIQPLKMFGELEKYKKENFYKKHKYIEFYTKEKIIKYQIIYIFVTTANSDFKYYNFINMNDKREFETFIEKCGELSFYNVEEKAQYKDKFITLSTCDYSKKDGRLVVIGKLIS